VLPPGTLEIVLRIRGVDLWEVGAAGRVLELRRRADRVTLNARFPACRMADPRDALIAELEARLADSEARRLAAEAAVVRLEVVLARLKVELARLEAVVARLEAMRDALETVCAARIRELQRGGPRPSTCHAAARAW
jgi:chromosome segregation ATPase